MIPSTLSHSSIGWLPQVAKSWYSQTCRNIPASVWQKGWDYGQNVSTGSLLQKHKEHKLEQPSICSRDYAGHCSNSQRGLESGETANVVYCPLSPTLSSTELISARAQNKGYYSYCSTSWCDHINKKVNGGRGGCNLNFLNPLEASDKTKCFFLKNRRTSVKPQRNLN